MSASIMARYMRIFLFSNMQHRDTVLHSLDELAKKCEEAKGQGLPGLVYGTGVLYITLLDKKGQCIVKKKEKLEYPLFMDVKRMEIKSLDASSKAVLHYDIIIDYVKPVANMIEEWRIKRVGRCSILTYTEPELAQLILFAGLSKDDVEATVNALRKIGISIPLSLRLELGIVQQKLQMIEQALGSIGWIVVTRIGPGISFAIMGGEKLGTQPEVQQLVQKAKGVSGIKLKRRIGGEEISVLLGKKASISISKKIPVTHFAELVRDLIKKLMQLKVLVPYSS